MVKREPIWHLSFRLTVVFQLDETEHWQASIYNAREMGVCEESSGAVSKLDGCQNRLLMAAGAADVNSGLIVQREEGDRIEQGARETYSFVQHKARPRRVESFPPRGAL